MLAIFMQVPEGTMALPKRVLPRWASWILSQPCATRSSGQWSWLYVHSTGLLVLRCMCAVLCPARFWSRRNLFTVSLTTTFLHQKHGAAGLAEPNGAGKRDSKSNQLVSSIGNSFPCLEL